MRPGQSKPNDLELAVPDSLAGKEPWIRSCLERLHVPGRTFAGSGHYAEFSCKESSAGV